MRKGKVYYGDVLAGIITEDDNGFSFIYEKEYLESNNAKPISLIMPLSKEPYTNSVIFPFFDGLIPEGWLLNIAEKNWKINSRDRMGLLLAFCKDCIGAVSIIPE
ncbi:MAG: HipA N-terminal domain-containing protein [Ignavibacteriaceae bacterium]